VFYWIYDYPSWAIGILFVAVLVAVNWIGIFVTRATVHSWLHRDKRTNEMVGIALSSYFVLFGLLLGLLAVATYQNFSSVGDIVDKEASSMSALWKEFSAYPQPIRGQLQNALREYARYTIEEGWDQQRKGIVPTGEPKRSGLIAKILLSFEPTKESEKLIHAEALHESTHRIELSRARMENVTLGLPADQDPSYPAQRSSFGVCIHGKDEAFRGRSRPGDGFHAGKEGIDFAPETQTWHC
jgi:hypothetical protein